jgi:hypothetical protein
MDDLKNDNTTPSIDETDEDLEWYQKQLENDEAGNWSCYTDVANGHDPEFIKDLADGNWSMAVTDRSDDPILIPTNRAVGQKNVFYKPGSTVTISVKGNTQFIAGIQNVIMTYAQPRINLKFQFVNSGGNVTIDNNYTGGGVTRCLGCQSPSISVSSAAAGLVLHEFGHALGMQHEMKNPNIKLTWIESVLVQMFGSASFVQSQITSTVNPSTVNALAFDKNSIMIYNLPAKTNVQGIDMRSSNDYTDLDRQWLIMTYGPPVGFTGSITQTPGTTPGTTLGTTRSTTLGTTRGKIIPRRTPAKRQTRPARAVSSTGDAPSQYDLNPPIVGIGTATVSGNMANVIITQPSWLDNVILFVLSFFS